MPSGSGAFIGRGCQTSASLVPIPDQWQEFLDDTNAKHRSSRLETALRLFPLLITMKFRKIIHGPTTYRGMFLGAREIEDRKMVEVWAYLCEQLDPYKPYIAVGYEEGIGEHQSFKKMNPRKILLKPEGLRLPFCFMHPIELRTVEVVESLIAVMLYYFLMAGLSDGAMRWAEFDTNFAGALELVVTNMRRESLGISQWASCSIAPALGDRRTDDVMNDTERSRGHDSSDSDDVVILRITPVARPELSPNLRRGAEQAFGAEYERDTNRNKVSRAPRMDEASTNTTCTALPNAQGLEEADASPIINIPEFRDEESQVRLATTSPSQNGLSDRQNSYCGTLNPAMPSATSTRGDTSIVRQPKTFEVVGQVYSAGSYLHTRCSSPLAEMIRPILIHREHYLLDFLPKTPVTFARQAGFKNHTHYALHVANYMPRESQEWPIFAIYYGRSEVNSQRCLSFVTSYGYHGANNQSTEMKLHSLHHHEVLAPFKILMDNPFNFTLNIRNEMIRVMIRYYFLLAQDKGLIDNPQLPVSPNTQINFRRVCKAFYSLAKKAETSSTNDGGDCHVAGDKS